jgi:hypothetical protein
MGHHPYNQYCGPAYALTPRTFFRPDPTQGLDETYGLCIDGAAQQVHIHDGTITVQQGAPSTAAVTLQTDISTYLGLLAGQIALDDAHRRRDGAG